MRCKACDTLLEAFELARVDKLTGEHLDLCSTCTHHSNDAIYRPMESEQDTHDIFDFFTE